MTTTKFIRIPILRGFEAIQEVYRATVKYGGMICGGYARYCVSPNGNPAKANDVDIYCQDEGVFNNLVEHFRSEGMEIAHVSECAISYVQPKIGRFKDSPPIQLIRPIDDKFLKTKGSVTEILDNFDFTVVRASVLNEKEALVDVDFIVDESYKRLVLKKIHSSLETFLRCMKYAQKGYFIEMSEARKIFYDDDSRIDFEEEHDKKYILNTYRSLLRRFNINEMYKKKVTLDRCAAREEEKKKNRKESVEYEVEL